MWATFARAALIVWLLVSTMLSVASSNPTVRTAKVVAEAGQGRAGIGGGPVASWWQILVAVASMRSGFPILGLSCSLFAYRFAQAK